MAGAYGDFPPPVPRSCSGLEGNEAGTLPEGYQGQAKGKASAGQPGDQFAGDGGRQPGTVGGRCSHGATLHPDRPRPQLAEGQRRGGAQVLGDLLSGRPLELGAMGEVTPLQPRRDLHTQVDLERLGSARLLLHRGIVENGVVAVNSAEAATTTSVSA